MFSSHDSSSSASIFPNNFSSSYPPPPPTIPPFLIDNDFTGNNNTCLLDDDPLILSSLLNNVPFLHPFPEETISNLTMFDATSGYNNNKNNNNIVATNYGSNNSYTTNYLSTHLQKPGGGGGGIGKKDRHSKIHTSQGLRDRRVRLSSEIARKFFDLQDMLEYDKPSNTLEWLFTKSENAIKELARRKTNGGGEEKDDEQFVVDFSNNKSLTTTYPQVVVNDKGRKLKWTQQNQRDQVACKKESRERARARARERTCYKKVQDMVEEIRCPVAAAAATTNNNTTQLITSSSIQSTQDELASIDQGNCGRWHQQIQLQPYPTPLPHHLQLLDSRDHQQHHGYDVVEESIMIKRNMMSTSSTHHQPNLAIPNANREPSFYNNNVLHDYNLFQPYSTPNWDPNGSFSNFCGMATMNLSTCYMKEWFSNLWKFLGGAHQSEWTLIC